MRGNSEMIDDRVLLHLFKEQDSEAERVGQEDDKARVLQSVQEQGWQDINGYNLQNSNSFCESRPIWGGRDSIQSWIHDTKE